MSNPAPLLSNECALIRFRWQFWIFTENTLSLISIFAVQESVEGVAAANALKSWSLTSRTSSDILRFGEMRDRVKKLEQDVTFFRGQLSVARSKEKNAVDTEAFILECLDATNLDLASKISFYSFVLLPARRSTFMFFFCCCSFCVKSNRRKETYWGSSQCLAILCIDKCWQLLE